MPSASPPRSSSDLPPCRSLPHTADLPKTYHPNTALARVPNCTACSSHSPQAENRLLAMRLFTPRWNSVDGYSSAVESLAKIHGSPIKRVVRAPTIIPLAGGSVIGRTSRLPGPAGIYLCGHEDGCLVLCFVLCCPLAHAHNHAPLRKPIRRRLAVHAHEREG